MRLRSLLVALGVVALSAARLSAQACLGTAGFSSGPYRIGAGLSSADGVKSYGASMAMGAKAGPFAAGTLARVEYDGVDGSGTAVGINAGYAMDLNPTRTAQFCPLASFVYQSGPDFDLGNVKGSTSSRALGLGGAFGGTVPMTPALDFVPFAAASYVLARATATIGGTSDSNSRDYTEIDVGAGFVFNRTLTIRPSVAIPVGIDGAKSAFQLAFAFNFGKH